MADTSFVIDIASQVSGAAATTAELDSIASQMSGVAANAAVFDDAIAKLTSDLDGARAASAAANQALAEGQSKYVQLERTALKAAQAVEKLEAIQAKIPAAQAKVAESKGLLEAAKAAGASQKEIKALTKNVEKAEKELAKMESAAAGLGAAREEAAAAKAAVDAYAGELTDLEQKAEQAAAAQGKLEHSLESVRKVQGRVNDRLGDAASNLSAFRSALGDIGGPIAEFGERLLFPAQAFVDLREKFGSGTAGMVVGVGLLARGATALIGVIVKVTAALVVGVAALGAYAIAASDAARKIGIAREAAEVLTPSLKGIPWGDITRETGIAEDRLRSIAIALDESKVSAADMPAALRAMAMAENALGAEGAAKFAAGMKSAKESVSEFAARVDRELGDKVARNMLGLEAQGGRFKASIRALFSDFEIDPALEGLRTLVGLFDKNSSTGRAMSAALHGIFDPLIANAQTAAYVIEAFALGLAIGAVKMYIALKPAIDKVSELLGLDTSDWTLGDALDIAAEAGEYIAPILAGVVLIFGGLVAAVVAVGAVAVAVFGLFNSVVVGTAVKIIKAVVSMVSKFGSLGKDMIVGLVGGIRSGAANVIAAITGVVGGAISAAKAALGIASPSKVFAEIGGNVSAGMAGGVDDGAAEVDSAMTSLVTPPQLPASTNTTTNTTTNAPSIVIQKVEFPGGKEAVAAFQAWLESLALQGAPA